MLPAKANEGERGSRQEKEGRWRVLIVDDHPLLRQGLHKVLELEPDMTVVGEAADGKECLELVEQVNPDVAVVDITMPGLNGLELTRLLRQRYPHLAVVILTIHDQSEYFLEAVKAGAQGYVLKDVDPSGIGEAIRAVAQGRTFYPERFLPRLAAEYQRLSAEEGAGVIRGGVFPYSLTQRERQILICLARGMTNARIASALSISEKTVKNHLTSLFRKLGVEDRTQAVLLAVKERLVEVE